jgi:hypothetical protein
MKARWDMGISCAVQPGANLFLFCVCFYGLGVGDYVLAFVSLIGLLTDLLSFMTWPDWHDRYPEELRDDMIPKDIR